MISRIITGLTWALVGMWLALSGLFLVMRLTGSEVMVVRSGSMQPAFDPGDLIIVEANHSPIEVGAVYTFVAPTAGNPVVTHRVVAPGEQPGTWRTKGDANTGVDKWELPSEAFQLQQTGRIPWLGWVVSAITTAGGRQLLLFGPLLAIAALLTWESVAVGVSAARSTHRHRRTAPHRPATR